VNHELQSKYNNFIISLVSTVCITFGFCCKRRMNNGIVMPVGSRGKLAVTWATIKVKE